MARLGESCHYGKRLPDSEEIAEPLTYELIRETIVQPQLDKILLPGNIGYIRINSFNEHTGKALKENLRYLEGLGMDKCILDLRRNAGGLLTSAEEVSELSDSALKTASAN